MVNENGDELLYGSVVTYTVLGGLNIHRAVANFLKCVCAKKTMKIDFRQSYCNENCCSLSSSLYILGLTI